MGDSEPVEEPPNDESSSSLDGGDDQSSGSSTRERRSSIDSDATEIAKPPGDLLDSETTLEATDSEDLDDDGFDTTDEADMYSGASATVRSSIWEHDYEGGRRYHHYRHGRYPLPNDDIEQEREYMKHVIHMEMTGGRLFNAPIESHPQRIMDLCTGTGLWPIAVSKLYPSAEIVGVDLSPIQPFMVPPNVRFLIDDVEDEWMDRGGYDFIHMRYSSIYMRDVDKLVQNAFDHLKPGGWIEFSDFCSFVRCDDGTMPEDYPVGKCALMAHQALLKDGMNTWVANELGETFKRIGFQNVQCKVMKTPIGAWPRDHHQRIIGAYFRDALQEFINALAAKPLRKSGLSDAELEVFLVTVRKSLCDKKVHSYLNFISWWAQK
ncbi:Methyltransferase pytC [Cladobotryum mycophilum]|uniref:Methyltransferase pytC n=1 Tax=Cladobotryum mycophilum TaxID=491253 RepID=A0ABR0T0A9_9HYPO